jgi:predicted nuclease with TOPRIM domain
MRAYVPLLLALILASFAILYLALTSNPDLKASYESLKKEHERLLSEYKKLNSTYNDLKREHENALNELKELKASYESLRKEHEKLLSSYNALNSSYSALRKEHEATLSELRTLRSEYESLARRYNELQEDFSALKREHENTLNELRNLRSEYDDLMSRYNKLQGDYNDLLNAYNLLKGYHSSAKQVRWYEKVAYEKLNSNWFKVELALWRDWYILKSDLRVLLLSDDYGQAGATMFAEMVRRDLSYNSDLYRGMIHEWLRDHPARNEVELANEIARLFYSLDHKYAYPGVDEPNAGLPLFPVELLAYNLGDCEDHAMLLAALYKTAGFRVRMITVPRHAALQIYLDGRWRFLEATIHFDDGGDAPCSFYSSSTVDDLERAFLNEYGGATYYYDEV